MKKANTINKTFGPVGSFAGIVIAIAGVALAFYSLAAIILILFGILVGFTAEKTIIDTEKHRIRHFNSYLGFINIGKWKDIVPGMKLGVQPFSRTYRTYSRSNRILDLKSKDFIIILYDKDQKPVIPVRRTSDMNAAREEINKLGKALSLELI